jgi:nifR3 family TIM-barrel protein
MKVKIYLAPMSGITDLAFRLISREFGVRHCFFEMLDANAVIYRHRQTLAMLRTLKEDTPVSVQLLGGDPHVMLDAAERVLALVKVLSLDVNGACPARKVLKKKAGAALLGDTARLGKIVHALASKLRLPVTVKLRTGLYGRDIKCCVGAAKVCEANGASAVYIHGRTLSQGYSGGVDYEAIRAVKEALDIPVFGSGNIFDPVMAKKMLDETGCDGILVARGALGNPWIFRAIEDYLKDGRIAKAPTLEQKKAILKRHLTYIKRYRDPLKGGGLGYLCKVAMWYIKGISEAARLRARIYKVRSYEELLDLINLVG